MAIWKLDHVNQNKLDSPDLHHFPSSKSPTRILQKHTRTINAPPGHPVIPRISHFPDQISPHFRAFCSCFTSISNWYPALNRQRHYLLSCPLLPPRPTASFSLSSVSGPVCVQRSKSLLCMDAIIVCSSSSSHSTIPAGEVAKRSQSVAASRTISRGCSKASSVWVCSVALVPVPSITINIMQSS